MEIFLTLHYHTITFTNKLYLVLSDSIRIIKQKCWCTVKSKYEPKNPQEFIFLTYKMSNIYVFLSRLISLLSYPLNEKYTI